MRILDLDPGDSRLAELLPVLQELRPELTAESFEAIYCEGWPQGLRFTGAFAGADDGGIGRCLGVAGWRIQALALYGRKLYVDDLVTTAHARSTGVGHALLGYLEQRAREAGCPVIDLDSGVHRHDAHRFYLRERMDITSHHFTKTL